MNMNQFYASIGSFITSTAALGILLLLMEAKAAPEKQLRPGEGGGIGDDLWPFFRIALVSVLFGSMMGTFTFLNVFDLVANIFGSLIKYIFPNGGEVSTTVFGRVISFGVTWAVLQIAWSIFGAKLHSSPQNTKPGTSTNTIWTTVTPFLLVGFVAFVAQSLIVDPGTHVSLSGFDLLHLIGEAFKAMITHAQDAAATTGAVK